MMTDNVVVIRFAEPSGAYEALSVLKQCDADGRLELASAAVVERSPQGELHVREGTVNDRVVGTASGSLIGMLIGLFGGPLGAVRGSGAGTLMGAAFDIERAETPDDALTVLGRALAPRSTAAIASVSEPMAEVLDSEMEKLGGEVTRMPTTEVMDDLNTAEEAAQDAAAEAHRTMLGKRKPELTANLGERVGTLKENLYV
jgi:uncharacterized membrane protein